MISLKVFRCCSFRSSIFSLRIKTAGHNTRFFHSRILYNMKTVYFRHTDGEEKVNITLNFSELNMSKVFNFERNILERVVDFSKKLNEKLNNSWEKKKKRKNETPVESIPALEAFMLLNDEQISDSLVFMDLFQSDFNGNLKLKILDSEYDVVINSPLISSMDLPEKLLVGCFVSAGNWKIQNTDLGQSEFVWSKSKYQQKQKWEKCGEGIFYKIKEDDLSHYLKLTCTPKLNEKVGPTLEVISKNPVEKFENLDIITSRQEFTKEKTKENEFRIVSYNILADMYIHTKAGKESLFTFCDPSFLEYDYRRSLLNTELVGYNADILCMQEVEKKFYNDNLAFFNIWGYESIFNLKEGFREGSAVLYNRNKFNLLSANSYKLTKELLTNPKFSDIKSKIEPNTKLTERLCNIASQIQVAVLGGFCNNILVVGNVHFYFHPDADHIRLLQGVISLRILLNEVEEIKKSVPDKKVSVLMCGDFNSTPECGIHQLLSEGSVDSNHFGWKGKEDEIIEDVSLTHSLNMKSCYSHDIYTNYTPAFKACIDYIYFQSEHLELKNIVPVLSEEVLSKFEGIPSRFLPSDHVALIADLKFTDSSGD